MKNGISLLNKKLGGYDPTRPPCGHSSQEGDFATASRGFSPLSWDIFYLLNRKLCVYESKPFYSRTIAAEKNFADDPCNCRISFSKGQLDHAGDDAKSRSGSG